MVVSAPTAEEQLRIMSRSARPPHSELSLTLTKELEEQLLPAMERAIKYEWNKNTADWETRTAKIVMEEEPFKEGGMRVAHKAWEMTGDRLVAGIAKYFKEREISSTMCFCEAMTQMLADDYAIEFNKALGSLRQVRFVPVTVLWLSERNGQIVSFEPYIDGKYVKHNDNDGNVDTKDELPQAFSHFTWESSNHKIVVCDIQGVGDLYTDPQIHSIDSEGFGAGNMGLDGIQKFFKTHICNGVCRLLGLPKVDPFNIHSPPSSLSEHMVEESSNCISNCGRSDSNGSSSEYSCEQSPKYAPAAAISRALEGARGARRLGGSACSVESDEGMGSNMGRTRSVEALKSAGSSRKSKSGVGSMWSSGKAFGKALIRAVKASVHSPPSSRSISPVSNRGPGSPSSGSTAAGELEALTSPKKFQGRKRFTGRRNSESYERSPRDNSPRSHVAVHE